jgi:hypothetical protein
MQLQPARCACICACNCNQLAAPVSAHANATSSPCLYLRMQLQPARSASARAAHPVHRSALPRILYSAAHRANATSSPRLYLRMQMQPARCACICACKCNQLAAPAARRTPRTCSSARASQYFALVSGFVWFVVLTFPKFNLYTLRIAILSCVRSSGGTELGNLAHCPGFDSGRKFSDFFYFRHFLHS